MSFTKLKFVSLHLTTKELFFKRTLIFVVCSLAYQHNGQWLFTGSCQCLHTKHFWMGFSTFLNYSDLFVKPKVALYHFVKSPKTKIKPENIHLEFPWTIYVELGNIVHLKAKRRTSGCNKTVEQQSLRCYDMDVPKWPPKAV